MIKIKSIWTTISGAISSLIPMMFTVCKSGVCTVACVSPLASLLGISSASLIASPLTQALFPLLIVVSAVSFTVSYYKLYVLPKYAKTNSTCEADCACTPVTKKSKQYLFSLYTFWIGLLASIFFITYYEYQNYKANTKLTDANSSVQNACCDTNKTCDSTTSLNITTISDTTEEKTPCCSGNQKCE